MNEVTEAWEQNAREGGTAIHPLRSLSEDQYWASGLSQAAAISRVCPTGNVLDFGCGDGRVARGFHQIGRMVTGADASPAMLSLLRERSPMVPGFQWDATTPAPPEFDNVVCLAVLIHHRHEDTRAIVRNLVSITHPGGRLVLDWPTDEYGIEADHWCRVTTWRAGERVRFAESLGLTLVSTELPWSVWEKEA